MTTTEVEAGHSQAQAALPESARAGDPFDYQALEEEWSENTPLLRRLLETFRRESASDLASLETALVARDATQVAKLAHRIKGSAAVMGARRVREQAALLEACGRRRELGEALICLETLRAELRRCSDFVVSMTRDR